MPVSGPGPYSKRTDKQPIRNPGGLPYGDNQALEAIQQAAPMQAAPPVPAAPIVPIHAPSQQPAQPVTSGADRGLGPDSSVLMQRPGAIQGTPLVQALSAASASDPSGQLAMLLTEAMKRGL
jgi:hypothetical protein